MKRWIACLLCLMMALALLPTAAAEETPKAVVSINATNFPDANFRAWVKANVAGGASTVTTDQLEAVTSIDCSYENIASLKGISRFPNLTALYCAGNHLAELDLNNNKKLIEVDCSDNQLTALSLSGCKQLKILDCAYNQLKTLNLSYNTKLEELDCSNNQLTKVNIENVKTLTHIDADNNQLTGINNLDKNPNLSYLSISNNKLTKIDVTKLLKLDCLDVSKNQLKTLDVTKNTLLTDLYASYNALTAIDVTKNTALVQLDLYDNQLKTIDLSKNTKLTRLYVSENWDLKALNVTKNTNLLVLECANTVVSELDLSKNTKLTTLNICETGISKLDLSKNTSLVYLYAFGCFLTQLDTSKQTNLKELDVSENFIEKLDLSQNTQLTSLNCYGNQINYLNLSKNTKLQSLDCANNRIEFLSVGCCPQLESLSCGNNRIRMLHLENNTKLTEMHAEISPQYTTDGVTLTTSGGSYYYNMKKLFETGGEAQYVKAYDSTYSYDKSTGSMRMPGNVSSFKYRFDTGKGDMIVNVDRYYSGDFEIAFEDWGGLKFKGTTPYMIWNGAERRAPFVVRDKTTGKVIDGQFYEFRYEQNVNPGTGYLYVRMRGNTEEKRVWFKIYLPPTTSTSVANTAGGIKITWKAVPGAAGYVVYRRAWNKSMTEWSKFDRWNNTTETTWTDTKVYAGTRYQYGVKAYFAQRKDAVTGATIGGVFDNYNLGEVGPLKTTVRIKTNKLSSVTAGTGKLTAKWTKIDVCTGYVVQTATNSAFTANKLETKITSPSTVSKAISGLTSGKTYYVRVRGYTEFNGTTYYGEWSNVLTCTVK